MKNKLIVVFVFAFLVNPFLGNACSMYKITKNGKTIVGNNEDWLSPNHQFWFERASENKLGVMYMGQLDNFAQGAINEAGLVFDGFFEPDNLPVKNTAGKLEISMTQTIQTIMQTMTNVEQVKAYMETINLSSLTNSMLVFVDTSGTYLIVEGDEMFLGDEPEKTFSNFYYSQTESLDKVNLDYFQSGQKFINATDGQSTLEYCAEAMGNFAQSKKLAVTQYSTVYDLKTLTIRVYLFQDYAEFVEIDLKQELEKENHNTMIPDLFPKESLGYQHYLKYNNEAHPTLLIEELLGNDKISEEEFTAMGFGNIINPIGYEWLVDKKNPEGAIKVFEYGLTLMPNNSNLYDSLGEAYYANGDWHNAIKNYAKSLTLNPENENAIVMISKIGEKRKEIEGVKVED